jgi:putative nucleotidyltransferase with HDIG domain
MNPNAAAAVMEKIETLPSLPAAVQHLCRVVDDPNISAAELAKIISSDEVLAARVLRVANSSFYSLPHKVTRISQAIMVIGFRGVRNLALGISAFSLDKAWDPALPLSREDFWRRSLAVATISQSLAKRYKIAGVEETFLGGLFHDIGKIVLIILFPREYSAVLDAAQAGKETLNALERKAFNIDHAAAGRELCKRWKIPDMLAQVVGSHHHAGVVEQRALERDRASRTGASSPEQRMPDADAMSRIVHVAVNLANTSGIGSSGDPLVLVDSLSVFGPGDRRNEPIIEDMQALPGEVRKVESFFELRPSGLPAHRWETLGEVAVTIKQSRTYELFALMLLPHGYTAFPWSPAAGSRAPSAVISDGTVPAELAARCARDRVPMLDYGQFKKESGDKNAVHAPKLHAWLNENLPRRPPPGQT